MQSPNGGQGHLPGMETARQKKGLVFQIVFDGGSLGNPGPGYGSYEITQGDQVVKSIDRMQHGDRLTNNQAEYMTLIAALESLSEDLGKHAKDASVEIFGDSKLVVNQVNGVWKVKHANMAPLVKRVKELSTTFGSFTITWHPRAKSVARLGH